MSFTSVTFFAFCALAAILYFAVPKKVKWIALLAFSYAFYWIGSGWLIFFIVCATLSTFGAGLALDTVNLRLDEARKNAKAAKAASAGKADAADTANAVGKAGAADADLAAVKSRAARSKKLILTAALLFDLAFLIYFKYGAFIAENINPAFEKLGLGALPIESVVMPLGISFYTFQATGYLIDMYRGRQRADRNLAKFALFLAYFPQIVQGPIGRHSALAQQLYEPHDFNYIRARSGILLIAYGLFKKLVIADRIGVFVDEVFGNEAAPLDGAIALTAALFYGLQLYCDFSGGIDIARGFSRILGIDLAENFRRPYYSRSLEEFWRRWHITLGEWMRDYIFYPLMLSKPFQKFSQQLRRRTRSAVIHKIPVAIATFVVFMAVGIWHGAAWHWVFYALFNAAVIASSVLLEPLYDKLHKITRISADSAPYTLFMRVRTVLIRSISLTLGRAPTLARANVMLACVFTNFSFGAFTDGSLLRHGLDMRDYVILICATAAVWWVSLLQERGQSVGELLARKPPAARWAVYVVSALAIALLFVDANAGEVNFIYGRF
jgi:D-alanyl-lipoteichoic acid acyltransferase DltB (MBOAT superfamily)